jgi:hypothetical protein
MAVAFPIDLLGGLRQRWTAAALAAWVRACSASRVARARVGYAAGLGMSAWGIGVLWGFGWALVAGGLACSVSFLLLYDVDGPR